MACKEMTWLATCVLVSVVASCALLWIIGRHEAVARHVNVTGVINAGGFVCRESWKGLFWEYPSYLSELVEDAGKLGCPTSPMDRLDIYIATSIPWYDTPIEKQLDEAIRRKARVLIHLADENCAWGRSAWAWYGRFQFVMRQYGCGLPYASKYKSHRNVIQIPLGYNAALGFGASLSTARKVASELRQQNRSGFHVPQRDFAWALPGTLKGRRQDACNIFTASCVGKSLCGPHSAQATASIYRRSQFIISPRGNENSDCFRHYEASILGAIPVVADSPVDVVSNYGHYCTTTPPWLFTSNWTAAAAVVSKLLHGKPAVVRSHQLSVVSWWVGEMECIRARIALVLKQQTGRDMGSEKRTLAQE